MRRFAVVFTLATGLAIATPASGGNLYQWITRDGTPTYSPDPPPAGIEYQLVGADLKPLPKNIDLANTAAVAVPNRPVPAAASVLKPPTMATRPAQKPVQTARAPLQKPVAQKPAAKWKPVRYADDPTPDKKTAARAPAKQIDDPIATARNSPECVRAKRRMAMLESQFATAETDEQMDSAVLQLHDHRLTLRSSCMVK